MYAPRTSGRRWKHDPASHGIFLHGGSNTTPKWYACDSRERRHLCNHFSLTLPSSTRHFRDDSPEMNRVRGNLLGDAPASGYREIVEPTFHRILARALKLRREFPWMAECPIYACTEFVYDRHCHSAGTLAVQLVAPGDPLDWERIADYSPLAVDIASAQLHRSLDAGVPSITSA